MTHTSCPTAIVDAPIELVWSLLTNPAGWGKFFDLRVTAVNPSGPAIGGQILEADTGPRFFPLKLRFEIVDIDAARYDLRIDGILPLGLRIREDLQCRALDKGSCRVTYN